MALVLNRPHSKANELKVGTTLAVARAEDKVITVGFWAIAAPSKADKFDSCTMSRSTDYLNVSFVRADDGLALLLDFVKMEA